MGLNTLVVSFYTEETPYQFEAMSLIASCQMHGIELEIEAIPSQGSWERNCAKKPRFILDKLLEKKRPIFWVDADAVFHKSPDFNPFQSFDLSLYEVPQRAHDRYFRYRAGSIFINYTPQAVQFAHDWVAHCEKALKEEKNLSFLDQTSLFDLLTLKPHLRFETLPLSYCKIFDTDSHLISQSEVVVEHFQASLRLKDLV